MSNVVDWGLEVSEFELLLRYYIYGRTNTLRKRMDSIILPTMS